MNKRVVLITGASSGIEQATAIEFGKLGYTVIAGYYNNETGVNDTLSAITLGGGECYKYNADLRDLKQIEKMIKDILAKHKKIDVLVNDAGIAYDRDFQDINKDEFFETIKVNLFAPFYLAKLVSASMIKNKYGKIVNVSSTNGTKTVSPECLDYNATKIALQSLTRDLAKQFAPFVNVNAVAPGWVDTDMNKDLPKEYLDEELSKIYLQRMAKPEEIANLIVFLASDKASYINGEVVVIDGGY